MSGRVPGVGSVYTKAAGAGSTVHPISNGTATTTSGDSHAPTGSSGTIHHVIVTTTSGAGTGMIEWYEGDASTELLPDFSNLSATTHIDVDCEYYNGFSFEPNFGTTVAVIFTPRD